MLFYLDNWMSTRADLTLPRRPNPGQGPPGLNENYARELMELHTLGVDGGYTQQDVTEVARCFTGWTIERPRDGGPFLSSAQLATTGQQARARPDDSRRRRRSGRRARDRHPRAPSLDRRASSPPKLGAALSCWTIRLRRSSDRHGQPRSASTDGDCRAVMTDARDVARFLVREAYRAKIKTPVRSGGERGARARRPSRHRARRGGTGA
jgi:hypothetical protein